MIALRIPNRWLFLGGKVLEKFCTLLYFPQPPTRVHFWSKPPAHESLKSYGIEVQNLFIALFLTIFQSQSKAIYFVFSSFAKFNKTPVCGKLLEKQFCQELHQIAINQYPDSILILILLDTRCFLDYRVLLDLWTIVNLSPPVSEWLNNVIWN